MVKKKNWAKIVMHKWFKHIRNDQKWNILLKAQLKSLAKRICSSNGSIVDEYNSYITVTIKTQQKNKTCFLGCIITQLKMVSRAAFLWFLLSLVFFLIKNGIKEIHQVFSSSAGGHKSLFSFFQPRRILGLLTCFTFRL